MEEMPSNIRKHGFKPGNQFGRLNKGKPRKPTSLDMKAFRAVKKALAKQLSQLGIELPVALPKPPLRPPAENQKSAKHAKYKKKHIVNERQFIAQPAEKPTQSDNFTSRGFIKPTLSAHWKKPVGKSKPPMLVDLPKNR